MDKRGGIVLAYKPGGAQGRQPGQRLPPPAQLWLEMFHVKRLRVSVPISHRFCG